MVRAGRGPDLCRRSRYDGRHGGVESRRFQLVAQALDGGKAHIDGECDARTQQARVVDPEIGAAAMGGDEGDRVGVVPMGERDTGAGGTGQGGGDAGDDFAGNAGGGECFHLFAAAAEDEGIAAFQANDTPALASQANEEGVDVALRHGVVALGLANIDAGGVAPGEVQDFGGAETVVHDDIRFAEEAQAAQADEIGGPGTGADEMDGPAGLSGALKAARVGLPRRRSSRRRGPGPRPGPVKMRSRTRRR